jgi:hypothetical protein
VAAERAHTAPPVDVALLPSWDAAVARTLHIYRQLADR